ncbi:MAG: hypothetical protein HEQ37_11530 [Acidovorax sp.]|nr:hypothetical protein [Acidovorax sp.]
MRSGYVIKIPRWSQLAAGMRSNRWEREMWTTWRLKFQWETLCPVIYADRFGLVVIMRRAEQPVSQAVVDDLPCYYPDITAETKHADFGALDGRVVALDYGLPLAQAVTDKRRYYAGFANMPAQQFPRSPRSDAWPDTDSPD